MVSARSSDREEEKPGRRVAVTGAASFFGRGLLPRLAGDARYERLLALDVRDPEIEHPKVVFRSMDLTRPAAGQELLEALRAYEIDTLVHLAFLGEPTHQSAWAHELEAIGTLHVLDACAEHRVQKIVMQSSTVVYGPHPGNPNFLSEEHPLRGLPGSRFVADRVEAERQLARHQQEHPETVCTSLRFAPILGPGFRNWVARYFSFPMPVTILGYDPLVQLLHETDAVDALTMAVGRDMAGAWNIVGDGVMPLTAALRACGRIPVPLPGPLARSWASTLWVLQLVSTPAAFLDFLRYLCIADGGKVRREVGFVPRYSTRETVLSFAVGRRPREVAGGIA